MEGPYARRTFPCIDEPPYKATYETTLYNEVNYSWSDDENEYYTISNMEIKNQETTDGWTKTDFEVVLGLYSKCNKVSYYSRRQLKCQLI